jgi:hypothetical protein
MKSRFSTDGFFSFLLPGKPGKIEMKKENREEVEVSLT